MDSGVSFHLPTNDHADYCRLCGFGFQTRRTPYSENGSYTQFGRKAIVLVATVSLLISLVNWAVSTILTALLVIALAKRTELRMDYRAAAAAAIIGMGATWALGISSSAAQLQANKDSLPESIYQLTGVIPFTETIFLWQSIVMTLVLIIVSIAIAYWSAPKVKTSRPCRILTWTLKLRKSQN